MAENVLSVRNLRTYFYTPSGVVPAVDDVSFNLHRGEILAIVGESGSGKSVTALSLMKLIAVPPGRYVSGEVWIDGRNVLALDERALTQVRGQALGMIFQNPRASLDPAFIIRSQLSETLRCHSPRTGATDIEVQCRSALSEVGFSDPERILASFPHQLSGGMCQRIALAMVLASSPRALLADEPTTSLDVGVQAKILLLLKRRNRDHGLPIVLITHDFSVVRALATRVIVMYAGQIQEEGAADQVLLEPRHPYTAALIESVPDPDSPRARLQQIQGEPPQLLNPPPGCRFAPRCKRVISHCHVAVPALTALPGGRKVRCHLVADTPP